MKILHFSDNHGYFFKLDGKFDLVLSTGDFFPNSAYAFSDKAREIEFQSSWLEDNIEKLKEMICDKPFVFCQGNHCFLPPEYMELQLRKHGIDAHNCVNKLITVQGVNFYGFPYINYIGGVWNYELEDHDMMNEVDSLMDVLNNTYVDVLACHSPPYGILDKSYSNIKLGCNYLSTGLNYKLSKDMEPSLIAFGHIHESNGITVKNGILYSNSATTYQKIEI